MTHNQCVQYHFWNWQPCDRLKDGHSLYMLHFPIPLDKTRHYVGISKTRNLLKRWRKHAEGQGAALTRALCQINTYFHVTLIENDRTFWDERRMKIAGHYDLKCSTCKDRENGKPLVTVHFGPISNLPALSHDTLSKYSFG